MTEQEDRLEKAFAIWETLIADTLIRASDAYTVDHKADKVAVLERIPQSLSFFVVRKQEAILRQQQTLLEAMKKQADSMKWHSWAMLILTVVILLAMGVQMWLSVKG